MGSIQASTSDLAIGHFLLTLDFLPGVDPSSNLYPMDIKLITPVPKPLKPYYNVFKPFSGEVWALVGAATVVTALVYAVLVSFHAMQDKSSLVSSGLEIFRILCSQS